MIVVVIIKLIEVGVVEPTNVSPFGKDWTYIPHGRVFESPCRCENLYLKVDRIKNNF